MAFLETIHSEIEEQHPKQDDCDDYDNTTFRPSYYKRTTDRRYANENTSRKGSGIMPFSNPDTTTEPSLAAVNSPVWEAMEVIGNINQNNQ